MNTIIIILILGWVVLLAAICLNIVAKMIRLTTWYDFLLLIKDHKVKALKRISLVSYLFLFIIYPAILGLVAYYLVKILIVYL